MKSVRSSKKGWACVGANKFWIMCVHMYNYSMLD